MPTASPDDPAHPVEPPLRSYKLRGRIRTGQLAALTDLWPWYGIDAEGGAFDAVATFGRTAPLVVEIGFGQGEAALAMAAADPDRDLVAIDVHRAGAGMLLREVHAAGLRNVRVLVGDAVPFLRHRLAAGTLDEVRIYFPDPWPKARHHKRRLVDATFVALVASRLRPAETDGPDDAGGRLHLATDWQPYATQMLDVVRGEPLLRLVDQLPRPVDDGSGPRPLGRPRTKFEGRGLAKGHVVRDLVAHRR